MNKKLLTIIFSTILVSTLFMSACSTANDSNEVSKNNNLDNQNWAVNETKENSDDGRKVDTSGGMTETEVSEESVQESSDKQLTKEDLGVKPYTYNVEDDINANKVEDIYTVSIDGNLITFPCKYEDITKCFDLYTIDTDMDEEIKVNPDLEAIGLSFELRATPKTGVGTIKFKFIPTEKDQKLKDMTCNEFTAIASDTENNKLMTIALPGNIKFGCTYSYLQDYYGKTGVSDHHANEQDQTWDIRVKKDDGGCITYFSAIDNKLNLIKNTYIIKSLEESKN